MLTFQNFNYTNFSLHAKTMSTLKFGAKTRSQAENKTKPQTTTPDAFHRIHKHKPSLKTANPTTPINQGPIYDEKNPFMATIHSVKTIVPKEDAPNSARYFQVVLDLSGSKFQVGKQGRLKPGHHVGLIPAHLAPGSKQAEEQTRWYSVGKTEAKLLPLLIKRVPVERYENPGFSMSNHLANLKPGDRIKVFGHHGDAKLEVNRRSDNIIMFSVGVAIQPHLGALETRFEKQKGKMGETYLYAGYEESDHAIAEDQLQKYAATDSKASNPLHYRKATSRQDPKQRVNHLIQADAEKLLPLLQQPNTYVYVCGLRGMDPAIQEALINEGKKHELDVKPLIETMKREKRWIVDWGDKDYVTNPNNA